MNSSMPLRSTTVSEAMGRATGRPYHRPTFPSRPDHTDRMSEPRVAVHSGRFGDALLQGLQSMLPGVELIRAGAAGGADVLVSLADDAPTIGEALDDDVRWVHILGAGIDGFPVEVVGDRRLTCSRGAGAPAIAEFALACMLAFEKRLPDNWITGPAR